MASDPRVPRTFYFVLGSNPEKADTAMKINARPSEAWCLAYQHSPNNEPFIMMNEESFKLLGNQIKKIIDV